MENFRDLAFQELKLKEGIARFNAESQHKILEALELAKRAHEWQMRDEGDPFIIHPIRVANILLNDLRIDDSELVIAGILHDVVEDTDVTAEEVISQFGERVGNLVIVLTRDKDKETKREKFEKDLKGPADVRLIKTCDWLDNLRSLPFRADRGERWERHLKEAKEMFITLAEATGNKWLIDEMEKAYSKVG